MANISKIFEAITEVVDAARKTRDTPALTGNLEALFADHIARKQDPKEFFDALEKSAGSKAMPKLLEGMSPEMKAAYLSKPRETALKRAKPTKEVEAPAKEAELSDDKVAAYRAQYGVSPGKGPALAPTSKKAAPITKKEAEKPRKVFQPQEKPAVSGTSGGQDIPEDQFLKSMADRPVANEVKPLEPSPEIGRVDADSYQQNINNLFPPDAGKTDIPDEYGQPVNKPTEFDSTEAIDDGIFMPATKPEQPDYEAMLNYDTALPQGSESLSAFGKPVPEAPASVPQPDTVFTTKNRAQAPATDEFGFPNNAKPWEGPAPTAKTPATSAADAPKSSRSRPLPSTSSWAAPSSGTNPPAPKSGKNYLAKGAAAFTAAGLAFAPHDKQQPDAVEAPAADTPPDTPADPAASVDAPPAETPPQEDAAKQGTAPTQPKGGGAGDDDPGKVGQAVQKAAQDTNEAIKKLPPEVGQQVKADIQENAQITADAVKALQDELAKAGEQYKDDIQTLRWTQFASGLADSLVKYAAASYGVAKKLDVAKYYNVAPQDFKPEFDMLKTEYQGKVKTISERIKQEFQAKQKEKDREFEMQKMGKQHENAAQLQEAREDATWELEAAKAGYAQALQTQKDAATMKMWERRLAAAQAKQDSVNKSMQNYAKIMAPGSKALDAATGTSGQVDEAERKAKQEWRVAGEAYANDLAKLKGNKKEEYIINRARLFNIAPKPGVISGATGGMFGGIDVEATNQAIMDYYRSKGEQAGPSKTTLDLRDTSSTSAAELSSISRPPQAPKRSLGIEQKRQKYEGEIKAHLGNHEVGVVYQSHGGVLGNYTVDKDGNVVWQD